jgi:uncharacterized membrane protein YadS
MISTPLRQRPNADDVMAYVPGVDWTTLIERNFAIMFAPMGAGKTEQVLSDGYSRQVLAVSFCVMLTIHATKMRLDEGTASAGNVVLRLGVIF